MADVRLARRQLDDALAELRRLVRGIHPPILTDRGLYQALSALAADSPLAVELHGDPADRHPAPARRVHCGCAAAARVPRRGLRAALLDLMAQGLSSSASCAALVLAPVPVEKHISNIFAKLDLPPADDSHRRVRAVLAHLNQ